MGILGGCVVGKPANGRGWRFMLRRWVANFVADRRLTFVAFAVVTAILVTGPFGRWAKQDGPSGFWASFYASWTANLVFFAILGVAGIVVSVYRPEKDEFSRRVRILFGGRQDAAVDHITETIRRIGYYAEDVIRTYRIKEFDAVAKAVLVRVEHRTVTRNFYDDLSAVDDAVVTLTPDPMDPPRDPVGHLISFSVNQANKVTHPIPIPPGGKFVHKEAIEIPSGGTSDVEVVTETWYSLDELHEYEPNRFAAQVRIVLVYEGNTPGKVVPVTVEVPARTVSRLAYYRELRLPEMRDRKPGQVAFSFRLELPQAEP
ncbi:MAG: hypothetical protein PGN33_01805 [Methylobacterium radiotolerans]